MPPMSQIAWPPECFEFFLPSSFLLSVSVPCNPISRYHAFHGQTMPTFVATTSCCSQLHLLGASKMQFERQNNVQSEGGVTGWARKPSHSPEQVPFHAPGVTDIQCLPLPWRPWSTGTRHGYPSTVREAYMTPTHP